MSKTVIEIFNSLKNNRPIQSYVTENSILSTSSSEGVVYAEYTGTDDKYYVIKISRTEESQTEAMHKNIQNPRRNNGNYLKTEFSHCEYQMGVFDLGLFRTDKSIPHHHIHKLCHWQSEPTVTPIKTAYSSRQLQNVWLDFKNR